MFAPRLLFSALWGMQILLHTIFYDTFYSFEVGTWITIFICLAFFLIGTLIPDFFYKTRTLKITRDTFNHSKIIDLFRIFIPFYICIGLFEGFDLYNSIQAISNVGLDLPKIREIVINDFNSNRILYNSFRVFYIGVGFSIFFTSFAKELSRNQLTLILITGITSALITTGRLYLLLYFISICILLYRTKKISVRGICIALLTFISLFFIIAILLEKGESDGNNSLIESIIWNSQVYLMSSLACFNNYVLTGTPEIPGGALLPNIAREIISMLGFNIPLKPPLNEFAFVPMQCNTYTFLFPLFHEASYIGVGLGAFCIGILHQYLYLKYIFSANPVWWYLFAISNFALFMTIFEDAYFSSPGFWLMLILPAVLYRAYPRRILNI